MRCGILRALLLALLIGAAGLPARGVPASADSSPPQLREEIWAFPFELPTLAYLVRPVGSGPFPLMVMNHGVSLNAKERRFFPLVEFRDAAFWFARQGYLVVAPVGPGYGGGGFDMPERGIYGPFFSHVGSCDNPNFRGAGLAIAKLDGWIIDYLIARKLVLPDKAVVVGQSAGGWGAIALLSQNPSPVRAVIVFAAGRGGRVNGKPNNNCAPDQLVEATAAFGRTSRIPSLWLYSENDTYFGPELSRRMHEAFTAAGGNAEYHLLPAIGGDGHFLIHSTEGMSLWSPLVLDFLRRHP
jgi:dienelactone hydrolase